MLDPVRLAQDLIRCPSITPNDAGALGVLETALKPLGFACERLVFEAPGTARTENLFARIGTGAPLFCFAGHTDVVPPGGLWRHDPFGAVVEDGTLYGRGAADMKSAIAAFAAAAARHLSPPVHGGSDGEAVEGGAPSGRYATTSPVNGGGKAQLNGSIALLITGDEEGDAFNGTVKVLDWLKDKGIRLDHCIVGEPSSIAAVGDQIKIGRRGSISFRLRVQGIQGHVGYPAAARNPIPALTDFVTRLSHMKLDEGTPYFEPSTLSFTSVDVGNPAGNVIPAEARAMFNIRFNDRHTPESLCDLVHNVAASVESDTACTLLLDHTCNAVAFVTEPGPFTRLIDDTVTAVTGRAPVHSTTGGTSDARFIKVHCPVAELGLPNASMHKVNECARVADIETLTDIYTALLGAYFAKPL